MCAARAREIAPSSNENAIFSFVRTLDSAVATAAAAAAVAVKRENTKKKKKVGKNRCSRPNHFAVKREYNVRCSSVFLRIVHLFKSRLEKIFSYSRCAHPYTYTVYVFGEHPQNGNSHGRRSRIYILVFGQSDGLKKLPRPLVPAAIALTRDTYYTTLHCCSTRQLLVVHID
uniref:Uncharacterized protein n=1 Tax=Trichogramma kaykai TaxID=54128 RepID=A0ABD2X6A9_9HYME